MGSETRNEAPDDGPARRAALVRDFASFLTDERGLTPRTTAIYGAHVEAFVTELCGGDAAPAPAAWTAAVVRAALAARAAGFGPGSESARLLTTAARSFLRFLFLRRRTGTDLSVAIPRFLTRKRPAPPRVLSAEEVERVLAVPDRGTPKGRRDYAVLLLLARLGLRAGEVVGLRLEDVDWRAGELVVKGKTRRTERLPLLREVGAALADCLRDRGRSACRRVFQRKHPPCVGFSGPAAVGHVVRAAMRRAAVPRGSRDAAHLFRHSLASRMLRRGAALPEIGGVLRHRSLASTERYARVDPATLRRAALPWPHGGAAS